MAIDRSAASRSAGETTGALRGTGGGCPADSAPTTSAAYQQEFTEYEFPLTNAKATLWLPVKLEREDAERLAEYVKALVLDD